MAALIKTLSTQLPKYAMTTKTAVVKFSKTQLAKDLAPPTPADLPAVIASVKNGVSMLPRYKELLNVPTKVALVNAAVCTEILCWFFAGEIIGRRSIIGYKLPKQ